MTIANVRRNLPKFSTLTACLALFGYASADSVVVSDWQPWETLPDSEKAAIAPYCSGGFVAYPLDSSSPNTWFIFNSATYNEDQNAQFNGNVQINTPGVVAQADQVNYAGQDRIGELNGDVSIHIPQVGFSSKQATISLENYYALLKEAEFVLHDQDMHGSAAQLERQNEQTFVAHDLSFTRCAPDSNAWRIKSSKLTIDNEKNVATAWNSRIEVQNVPVMYVPYLSFPLNDQPRTGLLIPSFGSGISVPYYVHLAPNYDDTLTLDYSGDKGLFARNEFRFLFEEHNGINQFDYQLASPSETEDSGDIDPSAANRWSVKHNQSGLLAGFGYDFSTRWVSDQNFDIELNPGSRNKVDFQTLNLALTRPLFGFNHKLSWNYSQPVINSSKTLESLNTTLTSTRENLTVTALTQKQTDYSGDEKEAALSDYTLLKQPEISLGYKNHLLPLGLIAQENAKYTEFQRDMPSKLEETLTSESLYLANQANRLHSSVILSRPFKRNSWFFTPTIEGYASHYELNNYLGYNLKDNYNNDEFTHLAWRGSLDQGFTVKKTQNQWQHLISPRLYFAYAPLQEQNAPFQEGSFSKKFDLFTTSRFSGTDRIADMQRLSTSLAYELKSQNETRFVLSTKKGVKLAQERMTLHSEAIEDVPSKYHQLSEISPITDWQPEYSDWNANIKIIPNDYFSFTGDLNYSHDWNDLTSFNATFAYTPEKHQFATLELSKASGETSHDPDQEKDKDEFNVEGNFHTIKLGTYLPVMQNVGIIGYSKAQAFNANSQNRNNKMTDAEWHKLESLDWDDLKLREMLIGVDYDACCWNVRLAMMAISFDEISNQNSLFPDKTNHKYYFEFTLKGVGAGFGTIETILQRLDFGYSSRLFNYR